MHYCSSREKKIILALRIIACNVWSILNSFNWKLLDGILQNPILCKQLCLLFLMYSRFKNQIQNLNFKNLILFC